MSHKDGRVVLSAWVEPALRDYAREAARVANLEFSRWVERAVRQTMARESADRAVDVFDGRRAWSKTNLGEQPLNKAEAHRLAHKLRDPKFYTARTKRAVNSLTVERGPKGGAA